LNPKNQKLRWSYLPNNKNKTRCGGVLSNKTGAGVILSSKRCYYVLKKPKCIAKPTSCSFTKTAYWSTVKKYNKEEQNNPLNSNL
jgi:hypothetical protein